MAMTRYQSWGRYPRRPQTARVLPAGAGDLGIGQGEQVLAFGNGRSYGDSCLATGTLLDTRRLDRIIAFDATTGIVRCEAGVLLCDLVARVLPAGWFVPVTPGTQFVTVGGAIANDVHGKNHHVRGTFGCHVPAFELMRSDDTRRICTPGENAGLYAGTIGGLGLTGLITWADLQLIPVTSRLITQTITPFGSLREFIDLARAADATHEYGVAWIDSLADRAELGRGLYIKGNHAPGQGSIAAGKSRVAMSVPFAPPVPLIGRASLRAFNALYRRQTLGRQKSGEVDYRPFFYPLDRIGAWNRLYGPRGLLQHQSVVPAAGGIEGAVEVVAELLRRSQRAGLGSFLTVLKVFGDRPSPGVMSFPQPGLTLTLDFANTGADVMGLLDELDRVVVAAGGRINPYKDARMSTAAFKSSFPQHERFTDAIDPAFRSCLWQRVMGST
jgi:FAD/FMN-containing dehydrogenase